MDIPNKEYGVQDLYGAVPFVSTCLINTKYLDINSIKLELFKKPKVILEQPPLTVDQMVAAAYSRLHVFIKAECDWLSFNLSKEFNAAHVSNALRVNLPPKYVKLDINDHSFEVQHKRLHLLSKKLSRGPDNGLGHLNNPISMGAAGGNGKPSLSFVGIIYDGGGGGNSGIRC